MTTPCRECKERTVSCHANCAKYLVYWEECEKRRKERLKEANVRDYFGERKIRKARVFKKKSLERIRTTYERWLLNADDAYGFGVIYGLRITIDVLEGKK